MCNQNHSTAKTSSPIDCSDSLSWFGDLEQPEFDIQFFESALARNAQYVDVLRALAEQLSRKGLWTRSIQIEDRLIDLRPTDAIAHYNRACSLAMQGAATDAIDALERAIGLGYCDFTHLEVDPDLDSLRQIPGFDKLIRRCVRSSQQQQRACALSDARNFLE
jgi:DNA-binding SARP family transcriptional activator